MNARRSDRIRRRAAAAVLMVSSANIASTLQLHAFPSRACECAFLQGLLLAWTGRLARTESLQ
jgi:hypothetical protein